MAYMHDFQHQAQGIAQLLFTNVLVTDLFCLCLLYPPLLKKICSFIVFYHIPPTKHAIIFNFFL